MKDINVIISIDKFFYFIQDLLIEHDISLCISYDKRTERILWQDRDKYFDIIKSQNSEVFLFSGQRKEIVNDDYFYDKIPSHSIVMSGGREDEEDIERINLRVISKKPDLIIKKFHRAVFTKLKESDLFGLGVVAGPFKRDFFYDKSPIEKGIVSDFSNRHMLSRYIIDK